jgi:diaminopimelate epimerase
MGGMQIAFTYGHGSGNAFPIVDARGLALADDTWAAIARALADRAGPVGSDGLLALTEGVDGAAFGFRMWNSDGSEAETCLNGLRLVARMGFAATGVEAAEVSLKTSRAMVARADDLAAGVYTVRETAGPAGLDAGAWPLAGAGRIVEAPVAQLGSQAFTAISMPNPHLVSFVEEIDEAELVRLWEICEAAPDWLPNRANISFVRVIPEGLFVRTAERGVGLTDSCGSAMAASTYAAALTGRIGYGREIVVRNKGGLVRARADEDAMVTLFGNATFEYEGRAEIDLATGTVRAFDMGELRADEIAAWGLAIA